MDRGYFAHNNSMGKLIEPSRQSPGEQSNTDETGPGKIDSLKKLRQLTLQSFCDARTLIRLYTRDLDPRILNDRALEQALIRFIRRSRHSRLQILIVDEQSLQGQDHRLVSLAQTYTSFVQIRVIPRDFHENYFAFYLVDRDQLILRKQSDRFEAQYLCLPSSEIVNKQRYFEDVWQQSTPAVHLRALHL